MKTQNDDLQSAAAVAATTAIAATSKTPFRTAFKITIGIGLAQLALVVMFFGSLAAIGGILYAVMK